MSKPLRSLSGLLDFDSAARWSSFRLAALELHKTPAAVSQQIKQLESVLGFNLFVREARRITLTEKGRELAALLATVLGDLQAKVATLQSGDEEKVLRISTTHSLAIKWLAPRIGAFTRAYPDLDIRIESNDGLVNLGDAGVDVAIRFGHVEPTDPRCLYRERMVAVYSPALLAPGQDALTLADLARFPLLYGDTPELWMKLLQENGYLNRQYTFARGYSNLAVLGQSAVAGQGIGLTAYSIAYHDIQSGALRMIACRSPAYDKGYRFLVNPAKEAMPKIERFRAWLQEEMQQMQRSLEG